MDVGPNTRAMRDVAASKGRAFPANLSFVVLPCVAPPRHFRPVFYYRSLVHLRHNVVLTTR